VLRSITFYFYDSLAGFPDGVETYGLVAGLWMSMFALGNCVGPSAAGVLVDAFDFKVGTLFVMALQLIVVRFKNPAKRIHVL